jgi:hypothetical protein
MQLIAFSNMSDPNPEIIAPSDLFLAFDYMFGPDYTSTGNLSDGNSAIGYVLYNYIDIFTDPSLNESRSINHTEIFTLGGLVALPMLMSQPTSGLGPTPDVDLSIPQVGLASDLYLSVDLSQSNLIAVIPKWVVIVYLIMSATVYVCCVVAMFLSLQRPQPSVSSFEVLDLASKAVSVTGKSHLSPYLTAEDVDGHAELNDSANNSVTFVQLLSRLKAGSDGDVRKRLEGRRLFIREGAQKEQSGEAGQ